MALEREQALCKADLHSQQALNELKMQLETQRLEHQRSEEKMKADYEQALTQIKYYHEQEKNSLQTRVEKSTNDLSSIIHQLQHRDSAELNDDRHVKRKREELEAEIQSLYSEVENIKKHHDLAIA